MVAVASRLVSLLDRLERAVGPADPLPATDGWELVLRENVAYLVDDQTRDRCFRRLRTTIGLEPGAILAATDDELAAVVAGMRPSERVERLRRCAQLRLDDAPWRAYPGIGRPGVERIELFSGRRAVLALESNGARALYRLGYGDRRPSYDAAYRSIQAAASVELPADVGVLQRAHQLLRRHGQTLCTRSAPDCERCPLSSTCPTARGDRPRTDPFTK